MSRHSLLLAALLALPCSLSANAAPATAQPRIIQNFDTGWKFLPSDAPNAQSPAFDDSSWSPVTLPHDWSIAGPVSADAPSRGAGGFFPTGIGWYRKSFTVPAADASPTAAHRTFIVFDGVMANSDVYLNGSLLGHRPYGYVSFVYELTPNLHPGANVLAVRVDDSQQPASRWYPGAGINRNVRLVTTGDTHIIPWGTFVTTPDVSADSAKVNVRSTVTNQSAASAVLTMRVTLTSPTGATVASTTTPAATSLAPGANADLSASLTVSHPDRWDLAHGALYTARVTLLRDGKPVDEESVPFGIREFHFDADQGFFLNGVHHKVYGVALHTDGGAVGTAVPLSVWQRRLTELRKLGVNAIRTAHNPPAPEFLDLADRMGFLVMDEMFDCWTVGKNTYDYHLYFKDWSIRDTTDTVMRDRNHPSIILWSAGNEIHDTPKPDVAIPILKSLVAAFHAADSTRPVTQALFRPNASHDYDDGLADLLDVVGQNYRENEILAAHAQKPTRKIIGTENTHDRNQWVAMRDHPEYAGQFLWSGIDYLGEAGRWPAIGSGSGLLLSNALTRPRALERQSWWSATPMVAMVRRVSAQRAAPVDPGYANATSTNQAAAPATPGAALPPLDPSVRFSQPLLADWSPKDTSPHTENVEVYTNAQEVELFLNGKSLGTQKLHADASPITYQVPFEPGTLKAVARGCVQPEPGSATSATASCADAGKVVATSELHTAGPPARLIFTADKPTTAITPDWNDVRYLTATLVDAGGNRISDNTTVIHFSASGPGAVLAVDNGNMTDHTPFPSPARTLYDGQVTAILRATGTGESGSGSGASKSSLITVTATADGVPAASLTLSTAPIAKEDPALANTSETDRGF